MPWLEDLLAQLQGGAQPPMMAPPASPFPDMPKPPDEAAMAAAAREAAGQRMARANQRRIDPFGMPDQNSAGIQLALDQAPAGTGFPGAMPAGAPDSSPFGMVPPSLAMAKSMTASAPKADPEPPMPGAVPMPRPRPVSTDLSAAARPAPEGETPLGAPAPPPAPMGIAAPQAAEPSFLSRLSEGAKGMAPALLAAGSALQGDNSVAASMLKQREALAAQQESQNVTAQALLKQGAPVADVRAAMKNPEMLKALIGQYYAKDKGVKLEKFKTKDAYGREVETAAWVNPDAQTITPVAVPGASKSADEAPQLNEAQQNRVKAIVEGREPYPSPNTRSGDAQLIREAVHAADPNFDAVNFTARQQTRKNFTSGKAAGNVTAFNTAIGHLGTLADSIDGLGNRSSPWYNRVTQPISENLDPKYAANLKKFEASRTAVADELTRAFRGSGGNVHDIVQWEKTINTADSPQALRAAVQQAAELLNSRIVSLGDEYNRGMGTTKSPMELLNPKAAAAFQHMLEGGKPPAAAGSAPVKPGNYVWKNGALVPE